MRECVHRARFVLQEPGALVEDCAIRVESSGRIVAIEPWLRARAAGAEVVDWGSAAIIPGLVNAHTHLELTRLGGQLKSFSSFTDWIGQLVRARNSWVDGDYASSLETGTRQLLSSGVTLAGDISSGRIGAEDAGLRLRRVVFGETLSLFPDRAGAAIAELTAILERPVSNPLLIRGVSPHAPYSVSPELYRSAAMLAKVRAAPLTTHAAETRAERQFLESGKGEFVDFLMRIDALPQGWRAPGMSPIRYLDRLGVLGTRCVLAHCNYLDDDEIACISRTRSSVVYCPRSHAFFGHDPHPVRELLDAGVNVALGTDSLASNDSLSMLDEMRYLFAARKDVPASEILHSATIGGAVALGFGETLGRLAPGRIADFAVLRIPESLGPRGLVEGILEGAGACIATVVQGETAWYAEERE